MTWKITIVTEGFEDRFGAAWTEPSPVSAIRFEVIGVVAGDFA